MAAGTVRLRVGRPIASIVLTADAVVKWLPPFGFTCTVHHLDARVGGGFRMSFRRTVGKGHSLASIVNWCRTRVAAPPTSLMVGLDRVK